LPEIGLIDHAFDPGSVCGEFCLAPRLEDPNPLVAEVQEQGRQIEFRCGEPASVKHQHSPAGSMACYLLVQVSHFLRG
jgi:hypothetical protein